MHSVCLALILNVLLNVYLTDAYAQLADTMLCADKECSETISEGKARLAYRPRDDKFLNLEKGDVVLVKSKNAGKKSHLWGGQVMGSDRFGFFPSSFIKEYIELVKKPKYNVSIKEFLKGVNGHISPDLYAGLIGENQRITVDKSKKKKTTTQSDSVKGDVDEVNAHTPADTESTEAKETKGIDQAPNKPVDDAGHGVDGSVSKQDSLSKVEGNKPSEDQVSTESLDKGGNLEANDGNGAESIRTSTPLPPHIAAIMEEISRKTDGEQENVGESKEHVAHVEGGAKLENEADHESSDKEDSPVTDSQAVQPDAPFEAKIDSFTSATKNSVDANGLKTVHEDSAKDSIIVTDEESNAAATQSIGSQNTDETTELLNEKEHHTSLDEMKSATDERLESLQSVQDHDNVPTSGAEIIHQDTSDDEDLTQESTSVDEDAVGIATSVSSTSVPQTEQQGHANENENTTSSDRNLQPAEAESLDDSNQEVKKTPENSIANDQDEHNNLQTDRSHNTDAEGSYKLTQSIGEENLGSKADVSNKDDEPFEDDIDDDFEIEYLVVSQEEKNDDDVINPQRTDDHKSGKNDTQLAEEQSTVQTRDAAVQTDYDKQPEAEHVTGKVENEMVLEPKKTNTEPEASSTLLSHSESKVQADGENSQENDKTGNKLVPNHEESSGSNEKVMTDNDVLESGENDGVITDKEETDAPQLGKDMKIDENTEIQSADDSRTQSEESSQNESQTGVVDGTSETSRQTDESSENNIHSGFDKTGQKHDAEAENVAPNSQHQESEFTGEDKSGSNDNEETAPVSSDDVSVWNITEKEKPTEEPNSDPLTSAGSDSLASHEGNNVGEDLSKSGSDEAIDLASATISGEVAMENSISTDSSSDNDEKVEPATGTDESQSVSDDEEIEPGLEINSDSGGGSQESGRQNESPSDQPQDSDRPHIPKDDTPDATPDRETSFNDEPDMTHTNDVAASNESGAGEQFSSEKSDGQYKLPSELSEASQGHSVTSEVSQDGEVGSSDAPNTTLTSDSKSVGKSDGVEEIGTRETDGHGKLPSDRTEDSEESQASSDSQHAANPDISQDEETSSNDKPVSTPTSDLSGSDRQDSLKLEKNHQSESSTNDSHDLSHESGDEEIRSNDPAPVVKDVEIPGVNESNNEAIVESSIPEADPSSNLDEVGGERKILRSQQHSSPGGSDENDNVKSPDTPKQDELTLHSPDLPPPGPPPESFHSKDTPAQSQSDDPKNEEQDSQDTISSSTTTEKASDESEESSNKVLQLNGMNERVDAKSDQASNPDYLELLGGSDDPEAAKRKVLHEGKLVDWDETVEEKPKDDQPLTWDEAISDDAESVREEPAVEHEHKPDHEVQRHPTPLHSEVDESTPGEVSLNTPVEEELVTQQVETTQPPLVQDILQEQVGTTPSPILEPETEKRLDNIITAEPQVTQDITTSPLNSKISEDGATDEAVEDRVESDIVKDVDLGDSVAHSSEQDGHEESFWLRIIIVVSNIPGDIVYICEPLLEIWVSLLPPEYRNDVFGVSWPVIFVTLFVGFTLICLLTCRSRSAKGRRKNELAQKTIEELRTQLENLSKEKVDIENDLRTKQNEIEIQQHQMSRSVEDKEGMLAEKTSLENTLHQFQSENQDMQRRYQELSQVIEEKDDQMRQMLANAHQLQERLQSQEQALVASKENIEKLQASVHEQENMKKDADTSIDKFKERIKNLEKSKGEVKKEGKVLKDQIDKLNDTIGNLQQRLDAELEEGEQRRQEIDVLKDCILQFKGAEEFLADDDDEDVESEESLGKQKEMMKAMVDVANIKRNLRQNEADKLQIMYELEAEKENRIGKEAKVTELEAVIQGDEVVKNKLERDIQTLESKLTVMQEFYAKREVEIQSKLGLEKSRLESNTSLLENKEKEQSELLHQLHTYKQMCEEAKQNYDESERKHKQEVVGFEKRAHDNWLACREAERKCEEANKLISRLQMEMGDMKMRLRDSERDMIIRPRPERHGPPGGPPPFGPPRRHMPPGSPLHFRNGPPDADSRRSPPPHRRPPSPGGSIPSDRPPSRPERPPSTHSLPPMDRRPPSGPPMGPGHSYGGTPGRPPYRDGPHPTRPAPRDMHPHGRPPSGPILRAPAGPMTSSPYMERPPIPPSHSPRAQAFMQSSLHATPPQPPLEGLRTGGQKPPSKGAPLGPHNSTPGGGNPFRRSKS